MCLECFPLDMVNRKESSFCFHQGVGVACPKQNRPEQTCWLWWFGHGFRFSIVCNARSSSTLTRLRLQLLGQASGMDPAEEKRQARWCLLVAAWSLSLKANQYAQVPGTSVPKLRSCVFGVTCRSQRALYRTKLSRSSPARSACASWCVRTTWGPKACMPPGHQLGRW